MNSQESLGPFSLRDGTPVNKLILKILEKKGLKSSVEIKSFLEPQLKDLPEPSLMRDLEKAATIIGSAIIKKSPILVWGDYDVDGTTATALLLLFFQAVQHENVDYYIPNRLFEGYGLQKESLKNISTDSTTNERLLITVDNGISAHHAVNTAKELGYTVIITDHHTPPETKVNADAILNPRQSDCKFPGKNLAGVGVAFYLVIGVRGYLQRNGYFEKSITSPNLKQFLDLVAIGTVADMVKLDTVNRILVRAGLETVAKRSNKGVSSLCDKNNLDSSLLRSENISFQLAPKINAAGRLGFAGNAVSLLISRSRIEAEDLATQLVKNNEERKSITIENFANAMLEVENSAIHTESSTVVAGDFHIGVAGIVASNLVDKYKKPAVVLCRQESGIYKGSARSIDEVNLYDALMECSSRLLGYGGHAMAAGMSIGKEEIVSFANDFDKAVCKQLQDYVAIGEANTEEEVVVSKLFQKDTLRQLLLLEPHGTGNPQPVFYDPDVNFTSVSRIGQDKSHLKLLINTGTSVVNGIGFGLSELSETCKSDQVKCMLYCPSLNYFRGKRAWQVRVVDIQLDKV